VLHADGVAAPRLKPNRRGVNVQTVQPGCLRAQLDAVQRQVKHVVGSLDQPIATGLFDDQVACEQRLEVVEHAKPVRRVGRIDRIAQIVPTVKDVRLHARGSKGEGRGRLVVLRIDAFERGRRGIAGHRGAPRGHAGADQHGVGHVAFVHPRVNPVAVGGAEGCGGVVKCRHAGCGLAERGVAPRGPLRAAHVVADDGAVRNGGVADPLGREAAGRIGRGSHQIARDHTAEVAGEQRGSAGLLRPTRDKDADIQRFIKRLGLAAEEDPFVIRRRVRAAPRRIGVALAHQAQPRRLVGGE